ncbi:MAG: Fe-S cluster assembly protein SufD [Pseudomonadota bacterium]
MSALAKFERRYKADNADLALKDWDQLIASNAPDWVQAFRKRGHEIVVEAGLPTPKLERFKYFNLPAWLKKQELSYQSFEFEINGPTNFASVANDDFSNVPDWAQDLITAQPLGEEKYGDLMLERLSDAFFSDALIIDVPEGEQITEPLHLKIPNKENAFLCPRIIVRVGRNADFTLHEEHQATHAQWNNAIIKIIVEEGARFCHYRYNMNGDQSCFTQNTSVHVAGNATYEAFTLTAGEGLSRNQVHVELQGAEASCDVNGINLLSNAQNADTTITIEHQAPNCRSNQNYRNVVTDKATGIFQGKVHVHRVAQQTDGYQLSNSLVLSHAATMNTKPELEIYADDVKCSHGATTGRIDDEALFYLRSRGIPEEEARSILIQAFVSEVIEEISHEATSEDVIYKLSQWLSTASLTFEAR